MRRLSWDSPRQSGYRGALTVADHADGSRVTVRVTIPDVPASAGEEINPACARPWTGSLASCAPGRHRLSLVTLIILVHRRGGSAQPENY